MTEYFLIESRSPFESLEVNNNYQLASDLANAGDDVTLFLVENGVFAARKTAESDGLNSLNNVNLLADEFSLRERAIDPEEIYNTIKVAEIDAVIEAMATGVKTMWL